MAYVNKYSDLKYKYKYKYPGLKYEYKYKYWNLKYKYKYLYSSTTRVQVQVPSTTCLVT